MAKKETAKKTEQAISNVNIGSFYDIKGRHYFTDDRSIAWVPDLVEVQKDSYNDFLTKWIDRVFHDAFPISDFSGEKIDIYYKGFNLEEPKYDAETCKRKNLNFEAPLKVRLEMLNKETGEIKEQDVYMGWVPMMTEEATFIVNWIERIIVNQSFDLKTLPKQCLNQMAPDKSISSGNTNFHACSLPQARIPTKSLFRKEGWEEITTVKSSALVCLLLYIARVIQRCNNFSFRFFLMKY